MKLLKLSHIQYILYSLLSLITIGYLLICSKFILAPLVLAILLSIVLLPLVRWVKKIVKSNLLSVSLVSLFVLILISILIVFFTSQAINFYEESPSFDKKVQEISTNFENILNKNLNVKSFKFEDLENNGTMKVLDSLSSFVYSSFGNVSAFISYITFIPLYFFLILLFRTKIKRILQSTLKAFKVKANSFIHSTLQMIQSYLKGLFLVILILGIMNSLGLFLLSVPYAFVLGFMAAILGVIPYVGTLLGGIIVLLVSYITQDSYLQLLYIFILFAVIQFIEGNIITPKIIGDKLNINPLLAILILLIGEQIWGLVGMIIALPASAIISILVQNIGQENFYEKS